MAEIPRRNTIYAINKFQKNILECSRNVSETPTVTHRIQRTFDRTNESD